MADVIDEYGNPIQLTDQHGNPVQLTDEHGNPMRLSGVAHSAAAAATGHDMQGGEVAVTVGDVLKSGAEETNYTIGSGGGSSQYQPQRPVETTTVGEVRRSSSSSSTSSSSGDEEQELHGELGEGRRRKKKGLTEKIKEKLTGEKHREDRQTTGSTGTVTTGSTGTIDTATTTTTTEQHEDEKKGVVRATEKTTTVTTVEHRDVEKKGMMEKIMEKLPGHHSH